MLPGLSQWLVAGALLALVVPKLTSLEAPDLSAIQEPGWLVLALGAESLSILCALVQQRCSVSCSSQRVGWRRLGRVTLAATAIGYVLPGGPTIAGFYCARRYRASGVGQEEAAGGQLLVCLVTAVAAGAMGLAGVVLGSSGEFAKRFPPSLWTGAGWLCAGLLVGGLLGLVVLRLPRLHRWLGSSRLLGRLLGAPSGPAVRLPPAAAPTQRLGVVALAVGSAVGILVFDLLSLLAALTAFGVHVTTATVVTAYVVVALVSLVPVTPGGLGLVEGGLFALLLVRGVPAASLMAGVLTYRLVSYWLVVLMGGVALVSERVVSARSRSGSGSHAGAATISPGSAATAGRRSAATTLTSTPVAHRAAADRAAQAVPTAVRAAALSSCRP